MRRYCKVLPWTSGTSLDIMGCTACVALCLGQILQCFTYSVMSASMLCQYIFSLVRCSIFSIPLWPSGNSLSILWYNSGGIHTLSPFNNNPLSMVNSSLAPKNWCAMWGTSLICLAIHLVWCSRLHRVWDPFL